MEYPKHDYKEYPKTLPADDFWGQVRRTVYGKSVSEEQIGMILDAIRRGLELKQADVLLDLACGNGYLSSYFYNDCSALFGVDVSSYLIDVAKENFEHTPNYRFALQDVADYVRTASDPGRFNKVLCYGSFSFFTADGALTTLDLLRQRFVNVERVFIGNLPDKDLADGFYPAGKDYTVELDNCETQIGIWRSVAEFNELARQTGWHLSVSRMPKAFFAAHYRFDAVLTPLG